MIVQMLMSFLELQMKKAGEPVWPSLDQAQRDEVVAMLARLIAKTVEANDVGDEEAHDE